jgi:hypothetical protein
LNGLTPVTIVASPGASTTRRIVKCINIQNRDTANVTITVNFVSAGGTRQIWKGTLTPNDTIVFGEEDMYVLDATTSSITCVMSAGPSSTQPDYISTWADAS